MLKALFEVAVKTVGLGKAKGDLDAMGKSAQNVGQAHLAANKAAGMHYNTQAKGVIGTANSTKSFSKLAETMNSGGGIVGAYATLAANVFAVTAAFNALKGAAQVEQITRGLEVLGARSGQSLGIVAKGLREVTNNSISTEQALRSTAQITSAGFNSDAVMRIGKAASDASLALGREMTDSMDRLTRGIIKLEPELLDELGLMTRLGEASSAYALQLGKPVSSLTTLEKRQGFMNAVLAEAELKFGGVSDSAGDLKNYDKLAATFADLTKNIFNTINAIGGLSIAGFFADNMTALAGAGVLFLSTLKSQLLPGLLSLTNKAAEAAAEAKESAIKEQQDILNFNQNPVYLDEIKLKGASAGVIDYTAALAANKQAIADTSKEIVTHSNSISGNSQKLAEAKDALRNHREVRIELTQALVANHNATTRQTAADAVASASTRNFGASIHFLKASILSYAQGAMASLTVTNAWTRTMVLGRTIAYAFALSIRMIGAALLSAIPIIGQIIFVVGLLVEGYNRFFKSDEAKKREKDLKQILSVTETTLEKEKALLKVRDSQASAASRTTQQIVIQSNAISELATAYAQLSKEAAKSAKSMESPEVAGFIDRFNPFDGARDNRLDAFSRQAQVGRNSAILEQIGARDFTDYGSKRGDLIDPASIAVLDSMHRIAPEVTQDVIDLYGGLDKMSDVELSEKVPEIIAEIGRRSAGAAELVQNLTTNLNELEKAYVSYLTTAAAKTPFDGLVTASSKVVSSINSLTLATASGVAAANEWQIILTSIGEKTRNTLSEQALSELGALESSIAAVRKLELLPESKRSATYEEELKAAKEAFNVARSKLPIIQREIIEQDRKLKILQQQDVLLQGQINIAKAILSVNARDNALTAEGVAAQIDAENAIKNLEIQRLNVSKSLLDLEVQKNAALIQELESKKLIQEIDNASYRTILLTNLETNRNLLDLRKRHNERNKNNQLELESVETQITLGQTAIAQLDSIEAATESLAATRLAQRTIESQIAAIQISQVTQAEKDAAIQKARLKTAVELYNIAESTRAVEFEIATNKAKIANIQNGLNGSLMEQLALQRASTAEELRKKKVQDAIAIANITADRAEANARRTAGAADVAADALYADRLASTIALQQKENERLITAAELRELELVTFDIRKEGLEWQKQSLDYVEKTIDAQNTLLNLERENVNLRATLARRERGIADSTKAAEANSLEVKEAEYKLLVDGLEMKLAMIDLEFSLLDAQRLMMIAQLRERQASGLLNQEQNNTLEAIITNLGAANIEAARGTARLAAIRTVDNAGLALRIASQRPGRETPLSRLEDVLRLQGRQESAIDTSINYRASDQGINTIIPNSLEPGQVAIPSLVDSNTNLITALNKLNDTISGVSSLAPSTSLAQTPFTSRHADPAILAGMVAAEIESKYPGLLTSEHSTQGGVTMGIGRSARSYHHSDQAFDVNVRNAGGDEWDNPVQRAMLQQLQRDLAQTYGSAIAESIFGTDAKHLNHLHIAFKTGFIDPVIQTISNSEPQIGAATVQAAAAAAANAVANLGVQAMPTIVDDITVAGRASAAAANDSTASAIINTPITDFAEQYLAVTDEILVNFKKLGPDGEAVATLVAGLAVVAAQTESAFATINSGASFGEKFQAAADLANSALSTIQGALSAASASKIAAIDSEIAAEQKRDGKSAESVAKIAALEKKKEAAARKAFEVNKKLQMAQAAIGIASAVIGALGSKPWGPWNFALAGAVGALGAAQLAMIAGTSYQGGGAVSAVATPSTLSIGKRGDSVDLARNNANAGGEIGYLRGTRGRGSNASNYSVIGSAYGGAMPRGYGNTAFVVGEHGPETITPETPITVRPMNDNSESQRALPPVNINIQALDAKGVEEILYGQRGNIIGMLREAANNSGQTFLENVNTAVYNKPNVGRL